MVGRGFLVPLFWGGGCLMVLRFWRGLVEYLVGIDKYRQSCSLSAPLFSPFLSFPFSFDLRYDRSVPFGGFPFQCGGV